MPSAGISEVLRVTEVCSLFFELSHRDRLGILMELKKGPMILTRLAEAVELTIQETSRHLARLEKMGLTEKDAEGRHNLTPYGSMVLDQVPALEFTNIHRDYFTSHSLEGIPREYLHRIGELAGSRLIDDLMTSLYQVGRVLQDAEEYILSITDQYFVSHCPYFEKAFRSGVAMRNIDYPYMLTLDGRPSEYTQPSFLEAYRQAKEEGRLQERILEEVGVYAYMSEKEVAILAFPLAGGRFDYFGFCSDSEAARKWCLDLFEYLWAGSVPRSQFLDEAQKWVIGTPGAAEALRKVGEQKTLLPEQTRKLEKRGLVSKGRLTYLGRVLHGRLIGDS